MAKHEVTITLVVESEGMAYDVRSWAALLVETQGDDQMRIKRSRISVTKYKPQTKED